MGGGCLVALAESALFFNSKISPPLLWPIKQISAKEHFISICPQPHNIAINSSFEHSGKQIGTLTGEWLEEALVPVPRG